MRQRPVSRIDVQDLFSNPQVRRAYVYYLSESAGSQKGGVDYLGTICRRKNDHSSQFFNTIHFDQQCRNRAERIMASVPFRHGIEFVKEDDGWGGSTSFAENLAYLVLGIPNVLGNQFRSFDRKEIEL